MEQAKKNPHFRDHVIPCFSDWTNNKIEFTQCKDVQIELRNFEFAGALFYALHQWGLRTTLLSGIVATEYTRNSLTMTPNAINNQL